MGEVVCISHFEAEMNGEENGCLDWYMAQGQ